MSKEAKQSCQSINNHTTVTIYFQFYQLLWNVTSIDCFNITSQNLRPFIITHIPWLKFIFEKGNFDHMNNDLTNGLEDYAYAWTSTRLRDKDICRGLVHCGPRHCFTQVLKKFADTGKVACKYYVLFHIVPLFLRLRKVKDLKKVLRVLAKSVYEYIRSICFMAFLVGTLRAGLCINWNQSEQNIVSFWECMTYLSPVSAASILFEDGSRRTEITYYVSAKAIRSLYLMLKRTLRIPLGKEVYVMHMAAMAGLYYVYNHQPDNLKFRGLFAEIFDDE